MRRSQRVCKRLEDGLGTLQDIVVPEPQHRVALATQPVIPAAICHALGVLPTVNLNDQLAVETNEIDYIRSDRRLPLELQIHKTVSPQEIPEPPLSISHI